jgi:hypothetical protein
MFGRVAGGRAGWRVELELARRRGLRAALGFRQWRLPDSAASFAWSC